MFSESMKERFNAVQCSDGVTIKNRFYVNAVEHKIIEIEMK